MLARPVGRVKVRCSLVDVSRQFRDESGLLLDSVVLALIILAQTNLLRVSVVLQRIEACGNKLQIIRKRDTNTHYANMTD